MAVWARVVFVIANLSLVAGVRQNVALKKPAWMSTTRNPSQSAGNAVDGVTTAVNETFSVHTKGNETTAWWKVDLQTQVQSAQVKIYFRTDYMRRRNGLQIYTSMANSSDAKDGDICYTVGGNKYGTDIRDVLTKTCPGTWRYLTVYTETSNDGTGAVLDFAEVQVWIDQACPAGRYEVDCNKDCNARHCLQESYCDPGTGACSGSQCQTGWSGPDCAVCTSGRYGVNCNKDCYARHCLRQSNCDPGTGACSGSQCQTGWSGIDCAVCTSGRYGVNCNKDCYARHCLRQSNCDPGTGACSGSQCQTGWSGIDCAVCTSGRYGVNCNKDCYARHCLRQSNCDPGTGACSGSQCQTGWSGIDCAVCTSGRYGVNCNKDCYARHCLRQSNCDPGTGACSGSQCQTGWSGIDCAVCTSGRYGVNCNKDCYARHCLRQSNCDPGTGACSGSQCQTGWSGIDCAVCTSGGYGVNCNKDCNARHCLQQSDCDPGTGSCSGSQCQTGWSGTDCAACITGRYGSNCDQICDARHCKMNSICDAIQGQCDSGCGDGYQGSDCIQECPNGTYGINCESTCGHCADTNTCHHVTGACPGVCQAGWQPDLCQTECDNRTYGLNCEKNCGHCNGTCNIADGRCLGGCTEGFNGSHCSVKLSALDGKDTSQLFPVSAVAGTVAGLLVAAILIIIVVLVIRKRRLHQGDINKHVAEFHPAAQESGAAGNVVLGENKAVHQKPPIKPKPAIHAASSKQLSSKDKDQEEEDVDEEVRSPDSCYYNADAEDAIRDVVVPELAATVAMLKQRKDGFEREYNRLPTGFTASYQDSQKPENSGKNKFRGYYPYDHNRVRLTLLPDTPGSDYINASLMHSYNQRKTYIAAQAPNKKTVGDFWRMIWEHSCSAVVMLTGLVEETKVKCEQYWPADGVMDVGLFTVEVEVTQIRANFTMRHMKVTSKATGESRTVVQFHFTSWPDHGVPDTLALASYIWLVRQTIEGTNGPLLVHCSAGIGRTGTYIAVDSLIDQARGEGVVDILGYVSVMRGQRKNMIQTAAQYECVFHCLVEMTTYGSTSMDVSNYTTSYGSIGMDATVDGRTLRQLSQMLVSETRDDAPNRHRMWVDGNPDFIVRVGPTLTCLRGYLQAVTPDPRLVKLLWKLVEENNVHNIIVVTPNPGLVEAEGKSKTHGGITVTTTSQTNLSADLSMINLQLATKAGRPRQVKMVNADAHLTMEAMTSHLLNHADLQNTSTQTHPVVVVHSNNDRKLAVSLCIMGNILSGIREDARVDVVDHVRTFLRCCPDLQFTQSDVQMFHDFAQQCILRTDPANTYANI
ncbi:uncharacterized protein LOC124113981 isoform X1 [Haliotis rufescens]|uniref:uncharacterized protein LOC124113981 isoform X1 n=1 Tax=Haliotis rufescens TaxID=6454 RepID=UPI00201F20A7|nr:uncharacterized protein LOC124113981 isoform X1 [Haliotis rufescens]